MTGALNSTAFHCVHSFSRVIVAAGSVKVGDMMEDHAVTKIKSIARTGIYAPLVASGSFMVQGEVVASSYVTAAKVDQVSAHDWVHFYVTPYRLFCLGVSPQHCDMEYSNEDGMPYYVEYGLKMLSWTFESGGSFAQGVFLVVTIPLILAFLALEKVMLASVPAKMMMAMTGMAAHKMMAGYTPKKKVL